MTHLLLENQEQYYCTFLRGKYNSKMAQVFYLP